MDSELKLLDWIQNPKNHFNIEMVSEIFQKYYFRHVTITVNEILLEEHTVKINYLKTL